jgi:hypothetical protein
MLIVLLDYPDGTNQQPRRLTTGLVKVSVKEAGV